MQSAELSLKKAKEDIANEAERVRYEEAYRVQQKLDAMKDQDNENLYRLKILNQTPEEAKARKAHLLQELRMMAYPYVR